MTWVAFVLVLASTVLLGLKKSYGWIVGGCGALIWFVWAIISETPALAFQQFLLISLSVYNFVSWSKK